MKKLIAILICIFLIASLAACGGAETDTPAQQSQSTPAASTSQSSASEDAAPADDTTVEDDTWAEDVYYEEETGEPGKTVEETLEPCETKTIDNYAEFVFAKLITTDIITAAHSGRPYKLYQEPEHKYVDAVFDWTNLSKETQQTFYILEATGVAPDGTEYSALNLFEHENDYGQPRWNIGQAGEIEPGNTERLHIAFLVDSDIESLRMTFRIRNYVYTCDYTLGDIFTNAKELKVGDVLESDEATLKFLGYEFTRQLLPSDTSGSYTCIRVQGVNEEDNTFLAPVFELTSKLDEMQMTDYFLFMTSKFEGTNDTYFDSQNPNVAYYDYKPVDWIPGLEAEIHPGKTYTIHYLMQTLLENMGKPMTMFLEFGGQEYVYREP